MDTSSDGQDRASATSLSRLGGASHYRDKLLHRSRAGNTSHTNLYEFPPSGQATLGVCLSAPAYLRETMANSPFTTRHLVDGLLRELKLHMPRVNQRSVPWLSWRLPQSLFEGADVTEIMYFLGRQFMLSESGEHHYSVAFDFEDLSPAKIALFKGLGFNSLEINFDQPRQLNPDSLRTSAGLAQDFHFDCLTLNLVSPMPQLLDALRRTCLPGQKFPCVITVDQFEQNPVNGEKFSRLFTGLRSLGYRVLGNDCFVARDSSLAMAQLRHHLRLTSHGYNCQNVRDILGLGPGNISNRGSQCHQNPADLSSWLQDDFKENLASPFPSGRLKAVLDQLLCYHRLDLRYFHDRYQMDLLPVISTAWTHLQSPTAELYTSTSDTLILTAEGILKLSELCDALPTQFGDIYTALPASVAVAE